ncbi:hypothetical protein BASA60_008521 [Batrachochytrium salamandrivorans]|nr:hypothetical protein BASA60_008521 [Batrachochytrium salamandrivorans]
MVYGLGACFNSMKDLCKVFRNDSLTHSSPMSTITSRLEYLGVCCYSQRSQSTDYPEVRNISTSAMRLQTTEVLSTVPYVRPSSLANLACLKHGATFSYSFAWRALQSHRQDISKADVISFGQIPYFLHEIEIANPGSTTYVAATSEACLLYSRKQEYANADTVLSPRSFRTFNQNRDNGRRHQMFQTGDHLFKVTSLTSGYTRMVNLATKTCSCMEFQEMQSPCAHAALAISTNCQPVNQFVDRSYLLSSLQAAYSQQIVSVNLDTIDCDEALQPPNVVKKAGRPRKVCLRSQGEVDDNDRYACKGCGLLGHNVQTCSRWQHPSVLPVDLEEGNQKLFQQLDIGNLNGGSGSKRTRVRNVVCINCGGNHCHKTPC